MQHTTNKGDLKIFWTTNVKHRGHLGFCILISGGVLYFGFPYKTLSFSVILIILLSPPNSIFSKH